MISGCKPGNEASSVCGCHVHVSLQIIVVSSFLDIHLTCSCHGVFCVTQECIRLESGHNGSPLGTPWNESTGSVHYVCACVRGNVCAR